MIRPFFTTTDDLWCVYLINTITGAKVLYHESDDYFETNDIYNQVIKTLKIRD